MQVYKEILFLLVGISHQMKPIVNSNHHSYVLMSLLTKITTISTNCSSYGSTILTINRKHRNLENIGENLKNLLIRWRTSSCHQTIILGKSNSRSYYRSLNYFSRWRRIERNWDSITPRHASSGVVVSFSILSPVVALKQKMPVWVLCGVISGWL